MKNKYLFIILGLFLPVVESIHAQEEDFFKRKTADNNEIVYVSFSELLSYPKKLDNKNIIISGYCAKVFSEDKDIFIFTSKDSADHIFIRESIALLYEKNKSTSSGDDENTYFTKIKSINDNYCSVQGRYSKTGVPILGVPSHGTIYVNYIDKGMMRDDSVRQK